jgi:hypothetical protein
VLPDALTVEHGDLADAGGAGLDVAPGKPALVDLLH